MHHVAALLLHDKTCSRCFNHTYVPEVEIVALKRQGWSTNNVLSGLEPYIRDTRHRRHYRWDR